jgi:hypothetical protein
MELIALERIVLYSGNLILLLNMFLFLLGLKARNHIQTNAVVWAWYSITWGLVLSLIELVIIKFILVKEFSYFTQVYSFMDSLGIHDFNFISPFSYLIKFICLGLFFRDALVNKQWKQIFHYAVWILVVFELVQVFVFKSYQGYDSVSSTVKNIFLIGGSGLLLYRIYAYPNMSLPPSKNPYFWICLGLLLPALAELFLEFIFTKLNQTDLLSFYKLYLVRNSSQMIGFTLLIVGIWQTKYLKFLPKAY